MANVKVDIKSHDAATGYVRKTSLLARYAKTQEGNLAQQLDCGARAFDLRPACKLGKVRMHHGALLVYTHLEHALQQAMGWANAHPDELVVVSLSHYDPNDDECRGKVWQVLADLKLMQSIGSDGSCEKLRGLTVDGAKNMSRLQGGGHLFVVEGEGRCSNANWNPSLLCHRRDGNCRKGSQNSEAINEELFDFIKQVASWTPLEDKLSTLPVHWQYDTNSFLKLFALDSSVLEDSKLSQVNYHLIDFIPQLKYVNFLQVDDVCNYGPSLREALITRAFSRRKLGSAQQ